MRMERPCSYLDWGARRRARQENLTPISVSCTIGPGSSPIPGDTVGPVIIISSAIRVTNPRPTRRSMPETTRRSSMSDSCRASTRWDVATPDSLGSFPASACSCVRANSDKMRASIGDICPSVSCVEARSAKSASTRRGRTGRSRIATCGDIAPPADESVTSVAYPSRMRDDTADIEARVAAKARQQIETAYAMIARGRRLSVT